MLHLDIAMNEKDIKQAILNNREFVEFLSPDKENGFLLFLVNGISFVVFHRIDDIFEIFLTSYFIGKIQPQLIGPFVNRMDRAIMEICAEKYPQK